MSLPLFISHDPDLDWLTALEFGRVDDGQPDERWMGVDDQLGFLQDEEGRYVGFKIVRFSEWDPDKRVFYEQPAVWDAPLLGLRGVGVNEIAVAARAHFGDAPSLNRELFSQAIAAGDDPDEARRLWEACLASGDSMTHFALGYTLLEQGEAQAAYGHLRYYAELAPAHAWNWMWYGMAAEAVGEFDEAAMAFERALSLDVERETDAALRLAALQRGSSWPGPRAPVASHTLAHEDRVRGCLLGGALGDALGAPLEFLSLDEILVRCGAEGFAGQITDDTQMTLFTAEGLVRAVVLSAAEEQIGFETVEAELDRAYARWLVTQGEKPPFAEDLDGWLLQVPDLHVRRGPGNTCLSALRAGRPVEDSKGCGGVMRAAPAGLLPGIEPGDAFRLGCDLAALTHGHPSGYLAAGAMAELIRELCGGAGLGSSLAAVTDQLTEHEDHEEVLSAMSAARELAEDSSVQPGPEAVESLGEGWVAEEALAIGVYCALAGRDVEHALHLAVEHSGDSDSTGAICGSLLGTELGWDALPAAWLERLELREVIERMAADLSDCFEPEVTETPEWRERYPAS